MHVPFPIPLEHTSCRKQTKTMQWKPLGHVLSSTPHQAFPLSAKPEKSPTVQSVPHPALSGNRSAVHLPVISTAFWSTGNNSWLDKYIYKRKQDKEKIKPQKRDRLSRQAPPQRPARQTTFLPTCPGLSLQRTSPPRAAAAAAAARQSQAVSEEKVLILRDSAAPFLRSGQVGKGWLEAAWLI